MRDVDKRARLRRREFLQGTAATVPAMAAAAGASITADAAWATAAQALSPKAMATLVRAARDIFPHDQLADRFYVAAIRPFDLQAVENPELRQLLEGGATALDKEAQARFGRDYLAVAWEGERVAVLQVIEQTPFFRKLHGDLIVSLYNQKELWPKFGYEGSSYEHGGYLERGFNDLDWLSDV